MRTFGVEEELLLVAPGSGAPVALAETIVRGCVEDTPERELQRQQVETETPPCTALDELADRLLDRGNGATLQRRVHEETGDLAAVVETAVARTLDG